MISSFYFLVALLALGYIWLKRRYSFWSRKGILHVDGSFPFGSLKGMGRSENLFEILDKFYKKYKGKVQFLGFYSFLSPSLLILDNELNREIFTKEFSSFSHRGMYHNKVDDPSSFSILTMEGAEWRERRTKLTPIYTSGKMKMMFGIVDSISDRLAKVIEKALEKSNTIELKAFAERFTADNIGNTAFGLECNCLEDESSEFLKYGRRLFDFTPLEIIKIFFSFSNPSVARKLGFRFNPKESSDFFMKTMYETFDYREKNKIIRNDFVSLLLGLKEHFTKEELAAEGLLVFSGGYETSSTLIIFTFYELSLNPDIQERLRDEINQSLEENDGKITYDSLNSMKYLAMVVNEILRKWPPFPFAARKCTKDFKVPGSDFVIEEGTTVNISIISLQRDPEYFPDPMKFDPERFSEENTKNIKPYTFMPFGEGPRNCLGMRFGLMQSKMAIVKLLMNFKFSPCARTTIPMRFKTTPPVIHPIDGMWLKAEKV